MQSDTLVGDETSQKCAVILGMLVKTVSVRALLFFFLLFSKTGCRAASGKELVSTYWVE